MEFKKVNLGEVIKVQIDNRGRNPEKYINYSKFPVIDNYLIKNEKYPNIKNVNRYIDEDTKNNFLRGHLEKDDVIITLVGNGIGNVTMVPSSKCVIIQNTLGLRCNELMTNDFLYYTLISNRNKIVKYNRGSSQPSIRKTDLFSYEINVPTINYQKKITKILNSLDSKIEINNKIISNLESQAQAIFKSWFVDFEPFQDGNFVESELGMIPEGWEVKPIGELLDFDIGGGWGKEKPQEKYLIPAYVIRGTDIPNSKLGYFNMDNYRYHTESNLKNRRLQVGDIIFESSGGSTNQDLGRMLLVTDELLNEYNNDIICASFCKLIRINDSSIRWFVYNLLEYSYKNKILTKYEVKSTGISNFSFTIFKDDFKIAVPNRKTMERYFNVTGNNINLSAKLGVQNTKLAELRDALLPKLMAGEIDVSNIKIEGEEVKNE